MPPWYVHPDYGTFVNKRGLTPEERQAILSWVKQGKPSGDLKKLPPLPAEKIGPADWLISKPDLVLPTPSYDLPATGDIDYKYAILPYFFSEDTWVQEIQ